MAPSSAARLLALLWAAAAAATACCVTASPLGVSPRLDLPSSTSIGVAPRTGWVDDRTVVREAVAAAAPAVTGVRAVLEVVVPSPSPTARVVCVAGATGCAAAAVSSTTPTAAARVAVAAAAAVASDDDGPLVVVGSADAPSKDDAVLVPGGAHSDAKIFFVDEDSDEDAIKEHKTKKKDKKTGSVPIVVSYDGWKGKTEDDIPINPDRRRHYNVNYDMDHDYSGISAPAHYSITPRPLYKTVRTSDVPVTFWDVPLGSESLLVHRLMKSSPVGNGLYPTPSPSYWRPTYVNGGSQWPRGPSTRYPGVYRGVVNKRNFQPVPSPGFYGGHPRVYPSQPGPTSSVWCPPSRSPGWPPSRPLYPTTTSTTTTKPVINVNGKLDFDDSEEDGKGGEIKKVPSDGDVVKIISRVELDDFRK